MTTELLCKAVATEQARMKVAAGYIEGYASVFDIVDLAGDVIRRGAFAKTIAESVPAGKVKLMVQHLSKGGSTMEVIGTVTQAREDEFGLWIHADLSSDATAQEARIKAVEGHVTGLSIGYKEIQTGKAILDNRPVNEVKEIRLYEVTLTPFPMCVEAGVTSAKDITPPQPEKSKAVDADAKAHQPDTAIVPPPTVDWGIVIRRRRLAMAQWEA